MKRRDFLKTVGSAMGCAGVSAASATATARQETSFTDGKLFNIVFIMVDDMGWADPSCYGNQAIQTPRIDTMAAEGMRFTQAYSGCVVSAPARSCLMTGFHMGHTSVRLNTGGVPLKREDVTVAELLRDAGYATGGFGKWGLGDLDTEGVPEKQGFDLFYGYYHQIHAHYYLPDYLIRNGEKEPLQGNQGFYQQFQHGKFKGPFPRVDEKSGLRRQFSADLILEETLQFIRSHKDEPFFCYCPWTLPHGEYVVPEDDPAWQAVKDKPWSVHARVVAAYNLIVDRHVGEVLDLLKELGLEESTLVCFCSDNGADQRFDGVLDSCGPLKGKKRSMHEGGIRAPFIARWTGHIQPGTESDHLCYFPDMLPTFCELVGVSIPEGIDGISILPTLLGKKAVGRKQACHDYLYWEWNLYDWRTEKLRENGLMRAARQGKWKAVQHASNRPVQIYDLEKDVGEEHDLSGKRQDILKQMERILQDARTEMRPQEEPQHEPGKPYR